MSTREKKTPKNIIAALHAAHWAITPESLSQIYEIAQRALDEPITTIEALESKLGKPVNTDGLMTVRDGVATIPVRGPLFRYANIFTMISGATSYETLATDFQQAIDDPKIRGIILAIDSPGGEVNGSAEFANMVFAARGAKPIISYVSGLGASAAYWIASAAGEVVAAPTAIIGSIGAVLSVSDRTKADEARGVKTIEFVSSQSPNKRLSASSAEGQSALQQLVDTLAQVFVDAVAQYRGVSVDTVLADFGQGGVFVGETAVDPGLVDRMGSYEAVHAELSQGKYTAPVRAEEARLSTLSEEDDSMNGKPSAAAPAAAAPSTAPAAPATPTVETPAATEPAAQPNPAETEAVAQPDAAQLERERILAIEALGRPGEEDLISECIHDPKCTPADAALRLRQADNTAGRRRLQSLAADDKNLNAPGPSAPASDENSVGAETRRILAAYNKVSSSNRSK